jgi:hypothetical protein
MTSLVSRKRLLTRAAAVSGGAIVAGGIVTSAAATPVELPFYVLDPDCCQGCNACRKHALNTLFANATAADLFRAHVYCKCAVVQGPMLPYDTWVALFGTPAVIARQSVDRRTAWVADVLAAASTPPAPPSPPAPSSLPVIPGPPTSAPGTPRPVSAPLIPAAQLTVRSIRIGRAKRALALRVRLATPVTLQARLIGPRGRLIVMHNFQAVAGKSLHTLRVPNGVRPGRYRVAVVLRGPDGSKSTLLRTVVIS